MRHLLSIAVAGAALALSACSQTGAADAAARGFGPGAGAACWGPAGPGSYGGPFGMMGPGDAMMGRGFAQGPRMRGGWGGLPADLTAEQRAQISDIQREMRARQWPLMQQMHELQWGDGADGDEAAQRRGYEQLAALQKQMFENMLQARSRIDAVLTPQQRDELRRGGRPAR